MSDKDDYKFESNKKYFSICIYTIFVILVSAIIIKSVWDWDNLMVNLNRYLSMLFPFITGAFIAYLLNPLVKLFDNSFFVKIIKVKSPGIRKILSITVTYVLAFGFIIITLLYIFPQLVKSITELVLLVPKAYDSTILVLESLEKKYPNINFGYLNNVIDEQLPDIFTYIKDALSNIIPLIYSYSVSFFTTIFNFIIAIIVSCYMLSDKRILLKGAKKLIYSILSEKKANSIINVIKECNKIFSGFIIGKTIDSLIIGVLCFIFMSLFKMSSSYSILISVIVGITNMIPYFGPYIGAVPGVLILLLINPIKALEFLIMILVLQQFDGLYLGPKILGNSTGLRPLWIIFSITIGGSLFGVAGMFFGVPTFAVIFYLVSELIEKRLKKKKINIE